MSPRHILDWTVEDVHALVASQEQESLVMDYKASLAIGDWSDRKRNELAKDICAFANSAGGLIVIGIGEDAHKPTVIDDGVDTRKASKEAIESALRARIAPRIDRLTIKEIPNPRKRFFSYFVISIPRSMRAPHMCNPFHVYYRRYNFECVPMEHYEVEDVRRRQSEPSLTFTCRLLATSDPPREGRLAYTLHAGVQNVGSVTARDVLVRLYIPQELVGVYTWTTNSFEQRMRYNGVPVHRFDAYLRDGAGPIPVFPKDDQPTYVTPSKRLHRDIRLFLPEAGHQALAGARLHAQVFAESMRMRSFDIPLAPLLSGAHHTVEPTDPPE